ncbi:putative signaling protein [bioreactor metagenome]|uniref:Putative signaling protein n=1 Tax=bioreactor metagenome TaxID=1076179 RepID=A0A645IBU4_9ZZZZ
MQSYILRNQGRTSALCLLDLDNLKCINDHFGHREGDFALSRFAKLVQGVAEPEDVFGRYGGDEFILLVPEIGETRMSTLPEQLVKSFESFNKTSHKPYYIEASFGLLPFVCAKDTSMENLLAEVDKLLYRDKKKKRRSAVKEPDAAG